MASDEHERIAECLTARERELDQRRQWVEACLRQEERNDG